MQNAPHTDLSDDAADQTSFSVSSLNQNKWKKFLTPKVIGIGLLALLLVVGLVAALLLSQISQDVRQQAVGDSYALEKCIASKGNFETYDAISGACVRDGFDWSDSSCSCTEGQGVDMIDVGATCKSDRGLFPARDVSMEGVFIDARPLFTHICHLGSATYSECDEGRSNYKGRCALPQEIASEENPTDFNRCVGLKGGLTAYSAEVSLCTQDGWKWSDAACACDVPTEQESCIGTFNYSRDAYDDAVTFCTEERRGTWSDSVCACQGGNSQTPYEACLADFGSPTEYEATKTICTEVNLGTWSDVSCTCTGALLASTSNASSCGTRDGLFRAGYAAPPRPANTTVCQNNGIPFYKCSSPFINGNNGGCSCPAGTVENSAGNDCISTASTQSTSAVGTGVFQDTIFKAE